MRYIENFELREWVKDTLRKTIFQKAHALAIQTGCDILVKLQDASAPTTHQFYATGPLQKAYNNHTLRKQPGEKLVSGETGLPLVDQAIQSDIPSEGLIGSMVESGEFMDESFGDQSGVSDEGMVQQDSSAVPMHLSLVSTGADETHVATSTPTTSISQTQTSQFESDANGASTDIQIKLEPSDEPGASAHTEEIETKPLEGGQSEFLSPEHIGSTGGSPMFAQPLGPSGSRMRYPVPISPKPYQCGVCQKAFRSLQVLQKHTQTFHMRTQSKLTSRRGRGRGSYHLNRPAQQTLQTSYSVYSGGTGQQTPTSTQSPLQDIPGTSSQQMAQMAQMASSQLAQPQSTPMAVTPSTSDFSQSPSGPIFHTPAPGPSSSTTPSLQQGQSTGRKKKTKNKQPKKTKSYRQNQKEKNPAKYAEYLEKQRTRSKDRRQKLKSIAVDENATNEMKALVEKERQGARSRQRRFRDKSRVDDGKPLPMTKQLTVKFGACKKASTTCSPGTTKQSEEYHKSVTEYWRVMQQRRRDRIKAGGGQKYRLYKERDNIRKKKKRDGDASRPSESSAMEELASSDAESPARGGFYSKQKKDTAVLAAASKPTCSESSAPAAASRPSENLSLDNQ